LWIAAFGLPLLLAGCDSMGLGTKAPPPARPIDYRTDDLGGAVFALDLPQNLEPLHAGSSASFDATSPFGAKHIRSNLVFADGDSIDGALPPPPAGHTYFLLGFPDKDKGLVQGAQKWLASLPPDNTTVAFAILPKLCETASVDPTTATFSIIPALPGSTEFAPIIANQPLISLIGTGQLPPCGRV
jgi:hypothetical protein